MNSSDPKSFYSSGDPARDLKLKADGVEYGEERLSAHLRSLCKPQPGHFYLRRPFSGHFFACHTRSVLVGVVLGQLLYPIYYGVMFFFRR